MDVEERVYWFKKKFRANPSCAFDNILVWSDSPGRSPSNGNSKCTQYQTMGSAVYLWTFLAYNRISKLLRCLSELSGLLSKEKVSYPFGKVSIKVFNYLNVQYSLLAPSLSLRHLCSNALLCLDDFHKFR